MTVFAIVLVLFLTGGGTASKVAVAPVTEDECKATALIIAQTWQDKKVTDDTGAEVTVLDAQAICIKVTKQDHA